MGTQNTKAIPDGLFIVKRQPFIDYINGELLVNEGGHVRVSDDARHEAAEIRLRNGETVGFTVDGVLFSTISLVDGCFKEVLINKEGPS
ncbi:MAG: hypothetical protein KKB70_06315 [Proteobacteria bacterium]|nr:hypothetical protein [Pseudomonadota bacterium]